MEDDDWILSLAFDRRMSDPDMLVCLLDDVGALGYPVEHLDDVERLFGVQRGVMVASWSQLGRPE